MKFVNVFNNKKGIILLMVFTVVGIVLIFSQYFGYYQLSDDYALDMVTYYSKADFFNNLESLSESSRVSYQMIHLADYLFMFGFYQLLGIVIYRLSKKYSNLGYIVFLPYIALGCDFIENIMVDIHLIIYPSQIEFFGYIAGYSTFMKFSFLYITLICISILGIHKLMKKFLK